jgi:hypothetical protein
MHAVGFKPRQFQCRRCAKRVLYYCECQFWEQQSLPTITTRLNWGPNPPRELRGAQLDRLKACKHCLSWLIVYSWVLDWLSKAEK